MHRRTEEQLIHLVNERRPFHLIHLRSRTARVGVLAIENRWPTGLRHHETGAEGPVHMDERAIVPHVDQSNGPRSGIETRCGKGEGAEGCIRCVFELARLPACARTTTGMLVLTVRSLTWPTSGIGSKEIRLIS